MEKLLSLLLGISFGLAISISQLGDPDVIQNFLDLAGAHFESTPLYVVIPAMVLIFLGRLSFKNRSESIYGGAFRVNDAGLNVDFKLIFGSILFGIGWGITGYCPGPAIVGIVSSQVENYGFLLAFLFGGILATTLLDDLKF